MKTLEFALHPNSSQQASLSGWLEALRWVWNEGLRLCLEFDRYSAWDKQSKTWTACCPRFGDEKIRWLKEGDNWIAAPYSPIATRRNPTRFFCPLPPAKEYRQPQLPNISEFSLASAFAHKRHPDKPWLKAIPANFIRGVTQSLNTAWQRYKKGEQGEPRFKGRGNSLETLTNNDAKIIKRDGDRLKIPNLGWIRLKELTQRWGETAISSLKICQRPSGWYVQLSGELPEKSFPNPSRPVAGVALICKGAHHATHYKRQTIQYRPHQLERKLHRLERQLAQQPNEGSEQLLEGLKAKISRAYTLIQARVHKLEARLLRLQRQLARQQFLSSNWQRTKKEIGKLHEQIRLRRRNLNHKLSTFLVRQYDTLAIQKIKPGPKKRPQPVPINTDPQQWAENGALERSRKNRYIADLGIGQFVSFVKSKAEKAGRKVVEVATETGLFGQELARKLQTEYISGRRYDECESELMPVKGGDSPSVQQEPGQPGHANPVGTTQSSTQGATTSAQTIDRSLQDSSESEAGQGFPRPP